MKLLKLANLLQDIAIILTASITVPFLAFNVLASYEPETTYIAPKEPIVLVETVKPVEVKTKSISSLTNTPTPIHEETFKITAYCACRKCCGKTDGITATGTKVEEDRTIAVDPKVIPYDTKVEINGVSGYVAEDCGGAIKGNEIDLYFDSHKEALAFGVQYLTVRWN